MLIEAIEAEVHLKTNHPALKVFVISEHGELVHSSAGGLPGRGTQFPHWGSAFSMSLRRCIT